jgi:hypothetical protein
MDIPASEYESRRHAFDLCRWINQQLRQMEKRSNIDEVYFERKGENVKRLIEEAIPISRLALRFSRPGNETYVTLCPERERFDALIEVEGFRPHSFKVEATTTETDETTMRRQALSRDGFVNLTGPIRRRGRTIISAGEMVDVREEEERFAALLLDRVRAKVESGRYDTDTAILAYMTQHQPLSLDVRSDLVRETAHYLQEAEHKPYEVFYCYTVGFAVDAASDFD